MSITRVWKNRHETVRGVNKGHAEFEIRLRPFFSYYGGKWRDTPKNYPAPKHKTIIEPFAGSAGYSLRHHTHNVALYEKDPIIAGLWKYLVAVSPAEILSIPDVPDGATVEDVGMTQEQAWLAGFWLNKGVSSPRRTPSLWMVKYQQSRPETYWGRLVRERIARQLKHIRHWKVHESSYEECDTNSEATWFVDPPYAGAGRHYRFGSKDIDYGSLSEWCRGLSGQAIVCENSGAEWLPFSQLSEVKTTRRGSRSKEVVWIKG